MSSLDNRQNSMTESHSNTDPLQLSGLNEQPVEQLSFPEYSAMLGMTSVPSTPTASGVEPVSQTRALSPSPLQTRELPEVQTGAFSTRSLPRDTNTLRQPVLIRGTGRKSVALRPPVSRRKPAMHAVVTVVLALIVLSALFVVMPVGAGGQNSLFKSIVGGSNNSMNITGVKNNNTALIAQQAATATVVTQDGFDQGAAAYAGLPTPPPIMSGNTGTTGGTGSTGGVPTSGGGLSRFFYGQCTYWANMRYQAITGHYVSWLGNANEWAAGAENSGWVVSSTPHIHSIIVLQAYVQGAGGYGHVAVVESIPRPGVVSASNWNWYANGGWATLSYWNFNYPAPGVSFVWYPGAA